MRIALAKLLLQQPIFYCSTNHQPPRPRSRNWLEDYLHNYPHPSCSFLTTASFSMPQSIKSQKIWNKRIYFYSGNYAKYLDQKTQRFEQLTAAAKISATASSNSKSSSTAFATRRPKRNRCRAASKSWKNRAHRTPPEEKTIHFTFPQPNPAQECVELVGASKNYGPKKFSWRRLSSSAATAG